MATDFVCGALAGAAADICLFPMDTLRARLMVSTAKGAARRGLLHEGASLVRAEGVGALYKGIGVHLFASIPANGIFYSTFDKTGSRLLTCEADKTIKIWKEDETATPETHPIQYKAEANKKKW